MVQSKLTHIHAMIKMILVGVNKTANWLKFSINCVGGNLLLLLHKKREVMKRWLDLLTVPIEPFLIKRVCASVR